MSDFDFQTRAGNEYGASASSAGSSGNFSPSGGGAMAAAPAGAGTNPLLATLPSASLKGPNLAFESTAAQLERAAYAYASSIYEPWYAAVSSLDAGAVRAAQAMVFGGWTMLKQQEAALKLMPMEVTDVMPMQAALVALEQARRMIGQVGLQEFDKQPVLGHSTMLDPGADPLPFVSHWGDCAATAVTTAQQVLDICGAAEEGKLSAQQSFEIGTLMSLHTEPMEVRWLDCMLIARGFYSLVHNQGVGGAMVSAAVRGANEELTLTRAGETAISPTLEAQMFQDADALSDEVGSTFDASAVKMVDIIRKYPPTERALFFRVLERRNLLANIAHRSEDFLPEGKAMAIAAIREAPGYEGWTFDEKMATERGVGEQAAYIGAEALRQLPGTLCQFAAGVFSGLSSLPLIGGVFATAAEGMTDLSKVADEMAGASDCGKGWRDLIAKGTGIGFISLAEGGAGAELKAAEAGEVLNGAMKVKEGYDLAQQAKGVYDTAVTFELVFDEVKDRWPVLAAAVPKALDALSELTTLSADDPDHMQKALEDISGAFEAAIEALGGVAESKYTAEGKKEAHEKAEAKEKAEHPDKAADPAAAPAQVAVDALPPGAPEALKEMQDAHRDLLNSTSVAEMAVAQIKMQDAANRVTLAFHSLAAQMPAESSTVEGGQPEAAKPEGAEPEAADAEGEGMVHEVGQKVLDSVIKAVIKVTEEILQKLREAAVDKIKELTGNKSPTHQSIGEIVEEALVSGFADGVGEAAADTLKELVTAALEFDLKELFGKEESEMLEPAVDHLVDYVMEKLELGEIIGEAVEGAVKGALGMKEEGEGGETKEPATEEAPPELAAAA